MAGTRRESTIRVALYARYSTDLQKAVSIEDQFLVCRQYAARENWIVVATYHDAAISGTTIIQRPGIKKLLADAKLDQFDVVLTEALDRLSRDQEDIAHIYKRLRFLEIKLITLNRGEITPLHIGVDGTMNANFIEELGNKIWRGSLGRVLEGKMAALPYGYKAVRRLSADGELILGEREIDEAEAEIVRRIFREYAAGASPIAIARGLNADGIEGPKGRLWRETEIRGDKRRLAGILNNEIYIGRLVWNKTRAVRNPETGKRGYRINPPDTWRITEIPKLRIVNNDLWKAVKARQEQIRERNADRAGPAQEYENRGRVLNLMHRPQSLLSGLLKCGQCGGNYILRGSKVKSGYYKYFVCGNHIDRLCLNQRGIKVELLEERVLRGLRDRLLDPTIIGEAMQAFGDEINRLNRERSSSRNANTKQLAQLQSKIQEIVRSIEDGGYSRALGERLHELEAREAELKERLLPVARLEIRPPTEKFLRKIERLSEALESPGERDEAMDLIRGLIDHIEITSDGNIGGKYTLTFHGDLISMIEQMRRHGEPVCDSDLLVGAFGRTNTPRDRYDSFLPSKWLIVREKSEVEMPPNSALQPRHQHLVLHTSRDIDDLNGNLPDATLLNLTAFQEQTPLPGAEWMAVRPLLSGALIGDPSAAIEAAHRITERLNEHSEDEERWHGEVVPGVGLVLCRTRQGVAERHLIDAAALLCT